MVTTREVLRGDERFGLHELTQEQLSLIDLFAFIEIDVCLVSPIACRQRLADTIVKVVAVVHGILGGPDDLLSR